MSNSDTNPDLCERDRLELKERDRDYNIMSSSSSYNSRTRKPIWTELCKGTQYRNSDRALLPKSDKTDEVLAWQYNPKGLLLVGPTRQGKTRSVWMLLKRMHEEGKTIKAYDGLGWFIEVAQAFRDMEKAEEWLYEIAAVDILFLDDIFRGKMTEAQDMALWGVLERRTSNNKPVIVTTNATGEALTAKLGDQLAPIISRLREFCQVVSF